MYEERPSATKIVVTLIAFAVGLMVVAGMIFAVATAMAPKTHPLPSAQQTAVPATVTPAAVPTDAPPPASPAATTPTVAPDPQPAAVPSPPTPQSAQPAPASTPRGNPYAGKVVVIDPGHQAHGDSRLEPIGPGSSTKKPRVTTGATGVATHNPESLINLRVALKLRDTLQMRGITVVMVRTKQNVDISNSARAAVANRKKADLFVRIHCDSSTNKSASGLSVLRPSPNQWTGPIVEPSGTAAAYVRSGLIAATGARDRGVNARNDLSGFNWSKVPTVLVEMGFLSNAAEDRKLGTSAYQTELADGLAEGISDYLTAR